MFPKLVPRLGLFLILLTGVASVAQQQSALTEREEVTAIDLVVELTRDGERAVEPPEALEPSSFSLLSGDRSLAVVGVESEASSEDWHLLLYFDYSLSSTATVRWAASALADRASSLTELGDVAVVVADPEPRRLLAATRDPDLLDQTLSGIFLKSETEHQAVSQREEFILRRDEEGGEKLLEPEMGRLLAGEESKLVVQQQDALLNLLVTDLPGTARRAVFLVSDGFDQRPEDFYGPAAAGHQAGERPLESATGEWSRTIAAYGWTVIVVAPAEVERAKRDGIVPAEDERTVGVRLPGIASRLEGSLNPQRAAALHELGQQLREQGRLVEAEDSLEEALEFYHDHPKYSLQRAAVLIDLGGVLRELDRYDEARRVLRRAVSLDPARADEVPFLAAELDEPLAALQLLAAASGGKVVAGEEDLSNALAALARRVRLTFQLRGAPDGELHPIRAALADSGLEVRGPAWVRFGTPATVLALRARRLLTGEFEKGDFEVKCSFKETSRTYSERRGLLQLEMRPPEDLAAKQGSSLRLTIGLAPEEGPLEISHRTVTLGEAPLEVPLDIADDIVWLTAVVDDVATGRWGGASTEP